MGNYLQNLGSTSKTGDNSTSKKRKRDESPDEQQCNSLQNLLHTPKR